MLSCIFLALVFVPGFSPNGEFPPSHLIEAHHLSKTENLSPPGGAPWSSSLLAPHIEEGFPLTTSGRDLCSGLWELRKAEQTAIFYLPKMITETCFFFLEALTKLPYLSQKNLVSFNQIQSSLYHCCVCWEWVGSSDWQSLTIITALHWYQPTAPWITHLVGSYSWFICLSSGSVFKLLS